MKNVSKELTGDIIQEDLIVQLRFSLFWETTDPFAIKFSIFNDGVTNWVFDIDLLRGGLISHVGMGDVKCYSNVSDYYIDLDNHSGKAHFRLDRQDVIDFLLLVPDTDDAIDISDSQLYEWMGN